jgi:EAL domain-containing protein (putative c-di-GMP-specific phosphodiesterase class I)
MADQDDRVPDLEDFHPYFQPVVSLQTGRLRGFELLARWRHPRRGWVKPGSFIPEAEAGGWLDELTWHLLRKTLAAGAGLPPPLVLSVNISPLQLLSTALPQRIQDLADEGRFPLERLMIEITESALTADLARARAIVLDLKRRGCKVALDDFGTGYSSLSQLESLPFDEVKSIAASAVRWPTSTAAGRSSRPSSAWGRASA